jgi:hypothetical protein
MRIKIFKTVVVLLALTPCCVIGLGQDPPANDVVAGIPVNYDESKVGTYTLPDPLLLLNGKQV